ncbi:DUF86 domain-containing protein [Rhodoferax sp.]|uniref:HepT-like ribonuclease domain-containing protein n=1 Tax=Rhodoferax sp. TaxID=50421 RepID=UPI0025F6A67E|nr:DUF86 domain-containing protein [Rhodoferax sp.]
MHAEDRIRLLHMVEAAQAALKFVGGKKQADLQSDQMLLFAVVRAIEILGEAANKVSEDLQSGNNSIPWRAIVGMRNRLVHAYFDIDTEMVWKTLQNEIPGLLGALQALLLKDQA